MSKRSTILAIDIGTTATKALLVRNDAVLARASVGYPLRTTATGHAEQDPEEIVAAVTEVVRQIRSEPNAPGVDAICFSAAMHCLIVLDSEQKALTPSIIWADRRADQEASALRADPRGLALYRRTGTPIHPMAWPAKLRYLAAHQQVLFQRARSFVGIKEYVLMRLTGELRCDHSMASATGLFNVANLKWDEEGLELAGVRADQLPCLCSTTAVFELGETGAQALGLPASTPLIVGASDGCLSNLGAGALMPRVAALTIGTSGALRTVVQEPQVDEDMRTFCYVLTEQHYVVGGAVNSGGMALNWLSRLMANSGADREDELQHESFDALFALAAQVAPGSEKLLFHPYLSGERAPLWSTDATASFVGLTMSHHYGHMARAVMEGILLNLYLVLEALEDASGPIERILAVGGYLRAEFSTQMLADVFGRTIDFPDDVDSSALGAARLAVFALGEADSLEQFAIAPGSCKQRFAEPRAAASYRQLHEVYGRLPKIMAPIYAQLAKLP
jgi:gluconokinase